jgi:NADH dehydrogenase [ubiquinone] 1 alpha subcomplex assembly factor 7
VTQLFDRLARKIRRKGAMSVADYMSFVLQHYYGTRDPLGRGGDFITAPEVSQIFGELIGVWCADTWQRMGSPSRLALVELGPGRGTLMADLLRAARTLPAFSAALAVHLVEISPVLRRAQEERLAGIGPTWHETLDTVPTGPALVVANEFFDALPVYQFVKTGEGWRERLVRLDQSGDGLSFTLAEQATTAVAFIPERLSNAATGTLYEVCPTAVATVSVLARRLGADGGAALVIDYGRMLGGTGDTLQAVRGHQRHDVLAEPGAADLTTHVNFSMLAEAAVSGCARVHGPVTQGSFLRVLGIEARTQALLRSATGPQAELLLTGTRRLIDGEEMGTLFKVMAITHPSLETLAGFPNA